MMISPNSNSAPPKCSSGFNQIFQPPYPSIPGPKQCTLLLATQYQHHPLSQPVFQEQGVRRTGEQTKVDIPASLGAEKQSPPSDTWDAHSLLPSVCRRKIGQPNSHWLDGWRARLRQEALAGDLCLVGLRRGFPFHGWCCPHQPSQPSLPVGPHRRCAGTAVCAAVQLARWEK